MRNPLNPLDWLNNAQQWFSRTEKSSGFRPYLIYLILCLGFALVLLYFFPQSHSIEYVALLLIVVPTISFVPLFAWKAKSEPNFCRSESHVQRMMKLELEMMGSESKQISAEELEQISLTDATKAPLMLEVDASSGSDK